MPLIINLETNTTYYRSNSLLSIIFLSLKMIVPVDCKRPKKKE